jgi:hypothetical protein
MLNGRTRTTSGAKRGTCLALLGVLGVFAGGAYSVYAQESHGKPGVPTPSITAKPARGTWRTSASFSYTDRWRRASFQCSLDRSRFRSCASPTRYPGPLAPGGHTFRVRALGPYRGRKLSRTASYSWLIDPQPPTPFITRHPTDPTSARTATFAFTHGEALRATLQCSIDARPWRACSSPSSYRKLSVGGHHFRVRAIDPPAPASRVARFDWHVVTQQARAEVLENFSISAGDIAGALLYPGAAPQTIRMTLANPNGISIFVTSLTVTVPSGPPGCPSATNIGLLQSSVSRAAPVQIRAHGSVTLPAQGRSAPTIQLVNLPVNQDACQNARFPLSFTGSAHS